MSAPVQNTQLQALLGQRVQAPRPQAGAAQRADFDAVLADRLKVSGHARTRLQSREIGLDAQAWERVVEGVERAAAKGAKESLVLVDDVALVVSVRNRTVITAVEKDRLKENVFTNIDSAVIA
jgi:flagellar operon protein